MDKRLVDEDRRALDGIATLLGTSSDWRVEYLEYIADAVATTERPHPGSLDGARYRTAFRTATGRNVRESYAQDGED